LGANLHDIPPTVPRRITTKSKIIVELFVQNIHKKHDIPQPLQKIQEPSGVTKWTQFEHLQLEDISQEIETILLDLETHCSLPTSGH
jgi:hypothetical protein